jgi:6-phosphogluconolactonase/glucosamine-6-phosphate isomerase/deaminase
MFNTTNIISKRLTKSKTKKRKSTIIISTTSTILKFFKKIAISKKLTTLKKSIKLKKIRVEDIQFILKKELVYF